MRSYFNYTSKLSVLLTNARLLELSHNQILEDPANLVFDINLSHHFSRNNNLRLSNKINKAIKNEKKSFFENSRSVLKQKKYIYKDLFFQDLVLKQIVVNILNKVFEIEKEKYILPVSFYITKTNKEASKALNLILKKTSVGFYSSNCKILNALTLAYFVKIIKQTILDQKFIKIVERLFGALEAKKKLAFKSSKCYQVFCNIYFGRFDIFIMEFLKKQINKVDYKFTNIQRKSLNHIEFLVSKALLIAKKIVLVNFKHNYSKKSTVPVVSYVRYLSHFFIGSLYLNGVLNNFFNKASFFLKSTLHLDVKMSSWVHLNLTSIAFCGIEKKKTYKAFNKSKMIFIKNLVSISRLRKEFFKFGIIRKTKKPKAIVYLITLYTQAILIWYNNLMFCLLYYYYKTFNYKKLVSNVYYFLKWSLLATLKKKHKKSVEKVILRYRKQKNNKVAPLLLRYNFATITTLKKCRRVSNNLFYIYEYGL